MKVSAKPLDQTPAPSPIPDEASSLGGITETSRDLSATNVEVVDELQRLAPKVPREKLVQIISRQYQGPIPSPELFRQYAEVIPDAPERILKVFEDDSSHVRDMQRNALQAQRDDSRRVHWMAFTLVAIGFGLSVLFASMGKDILAGGLLTTTLVGTIGGLINSLNGKRAPADDERDADDPVRRGSAKGKRKLPKR